MVWVYLFEAKGIQRYILETGRRRDLVGASELVARLARSNGGDLLEDVLLACRAKEEVKVARRAGGVFLLCAEKRETLVEIRALWRLAVHLSRPGLEFADALTLPEGRATYDAAIKDIYAHGSGVRENGIAAVAPFGGPATAFVQRTGRPALAMTRKDKEDPEKSKDSDDRVTRPQAEVADALRKKPDDDVVAQRFLHERDRSLFIFPRNLTDEKAAGPHNPLFPWTGDKRWIAVIHVDLSGVGQFFRNISNAVAAAAPDQDIPAALLKASTRLEMAVEEAAATATKKVLLCGRLTSVRTEGAKRRIAPARPIVLGGDDITIIVRADYAFAFARELLTLIESHTADAMEALKCDYPSAELPPRLSACAGVAFLSATHPFDAGNALAEELCKAAKKTAKKAVKPGSIPPSSLAFHVMSATVRERYKDMLGSELTARVGAREVLLTFGPYFAGSAAPADKRTPHADDLDALVDALDKIEGLGPLRAMQAAYGDDPTEAERLWRRWCERKNPQAGEGGAPTPPESVATPLEALGCSADSHPPECILEESTDDNPARRATPIFDALRLLAFKINEDADVDEEAAA